MKFVIVWKLHSLSIHSRYTLHLGVRGPLGQLLEPLSHFIILQDVERPEIDPLVSQETNRRPAETAPRRVRGTLHEEHDLLRRDETLQSTF